MMEDTIRITTVTLTQVLTIQTGPGVSFKEYESGKGISKLERWGCPTEENTLWIVEDVAAVQTLITWEKGNDPTSQPNNTPKHQTVEMWKRTTTVRVQNLVELRDLLQENTEWETSYIFGRVPTEIQSWNKVMSPLVYSLPPQACCPRYVNKNPVIVSGIRELTHSPKQNPPLQEKFLDCFCPVCWSFQNFRHNKDEVRDWISLKKTLCNNKITDPALLVKGLKDPIKDSEIQKIGDNYLKNKKAPGPESFQTELI